MAWRGPPGAIVTPAAAVAAVCPVGWEEDFDRSQMSTQVMIGRTSPQDVPDFLYTLEVTAAIPGPGGLAADPNQEAATVLWISKLDMNGVDAGVFLNFLNHHSELIYTAPANDGANPPIPEKSRTYKVLGDAIEHDSYYEVPVFWTDGTAHVPSGLVTVKLQIGAEVPLLFFDPYGVDHYGKMTFSRTDLISMRRDLFQKIADRILEVRGSNSVPRLEAVTLDARKGDKMATMEMMATAAPEKPSRYRMFLNADGRTIFDRMCFVSAVRHFISDDEWTVRITLDVADWAALL